MSKLKGLIAIAKLAESEGMVLLGGVRALGRLFGKDLTADEQLEIETAVVADATRRRDESLLMTGEGEDDGA